MAISYWVQFGIVNASDVANCWIAVEVTRTRPLLLARCRDESGCHYLAIPASSQSKNRVQARDFAESCDDARAEVVA